MKHNIPERKSYLGVSATFIYISYHLEIVSVMVEKFGIHLARVFCENEEYTFSKLTDFYEISGGILFLLVVHSVFFLLEVFILLIITMTVTFASRGVCV